MRRPILALLLLATLLPAPAFAASRDSLVVVTLNLWHDQHDWPARRGRILEAIRAIRPDVLCLQEVLQHATLPNQAIALAESLGWHANFVSVDSVTRVKRYGNAILTPHRVRREDGVFLKPLDDWRVAAHVRIRVRGHDVDVYDTHLCYTDDGGPIRAKQVEDLLAFVARTRGKGPVVLAGDFNTTLGTSELASIEANWMDAFATAHPGVTGADAVTMNPRFDDHPRAIDHIFATRDGSAAVRSCEILFREARPDSVWASDHFGVRATLELRGR